MFEFAGSPVPVRPDLVDAYGSIWHHLATPGPTLTGPDRIALSKHARAVRAEAEPTPSDLDPGLLQLGATLLSDPGAVDTHLVRSVADEVGDPMVVEAIAIISMLSAVDGAHRGLGVDLEPLPEPLPGSPTGVIADGFKRRRTHVPMPPGPIPVALDLLPSEGRAYVDSFGPQYMTGAEMALDDFRRSPGLNRAQIEIVSSRTSIHNKCFY